MLIASEKDYTELLKRLHSKATSVIAYDLETTGLEPFRQDQLIGVAIMVPDLTGKTPGDSYYVPFRHQTGDNLPIENLYRLAPYLANPEKVLMGFNVKFDVHFTEADRMPVHNQLIDVMLGAHLANENEMSFALKRLGAKYVDKGAAKAEADLMQALKDRKLKKGDMSHLPPEIVAPYAEQDVQLTWALAKVYSKNLTDQGINHLWPDINKYLEAVITMERCGVMVDIDGCRRNLATAEKNQKRLWEEMSALAGWDFNPKSVPQLQKVLGQHGTDKAALRKSKHPIVPLLLEHRAWAKATDTFYRGLLDRMDSNNRVHPNLSLIGTISSRLSCSNPNLQALPKRSGKIYKVRDLIVAPPGYVLMSWDWNQAELRLLAHYTQDPFLVEAFRENKDIHGETAAALGISRDAAKRINFGSVYGVGADTLAEELGVQREVAANYLDKYHQTVPGVRKMYRKAARVADKDRKIPMWTGRLRHYRQEDATHKAMSNLIQGGVAEMMRVAITKLHDVMRGTKARQILQVHDEVLFEIPRGQEVEWSIEIKRIMEDFGFHVPMVADGKIGLSWGSRHMQPIGCDLAGVPTIPEL